ncbi:hypothetical protein ACWDRB_47835 [Nonomuraea sp. NPDC003707]
MDAIIIALNLMEKELRQRYGNAATWAASYAAAAKGSSSTANGGCGLPERSAEELSEAP